MTSIVNLTPHTININGVDIASSGLARVATMTTQIGIVNGIPINHVVMGNVTGLPDPQQDTVFIVSRIVADAVKDRQDVLIVDKTIRDADGKITGCSALAHV